MLCPTCGHLLQKLLVTTNSGGKFEVDHCGRCGGTWFDPYEINRIPYHEVIRIAHLTVLPKSPPAEMKNNLCPRCQSKLEKYHSEIMPKGVNLLRCPKDKGIWATQKALEEFKKNQEETIKEYKVRKIAFPSLSVVFAPAIFIFLLFLSTLITVTNLDKAKESRISAAAIMDQLQIVSISPTAVSITFKTKTSVKSSISYGVSSLELITRSISHQPTTNHQILITNLKPDTVYLYRIILEDQTGRKYTTEIRPLGTEAEFIDKSM